MRDNPRYLGDGVYAYFDGQGVELRTNSFDNPENTIYLEPEVFQALIEFYNSTTESESDL